MLMTLCYMETENSVLMLYRNKKKNDVNRGKWIGVGGKLEKNEKPENGIIREIKEETGYTANRCEFRGIVVFNYNENPSEYMYLYTCEDFYGKLKECNEGELKWIPKDEISNLNLWEGDRIFLDLIGKNSPFFYLTLNYANDNLVSHELEFVDREYTVFEVFVPEKYIQVIVDELAKYELLREGCYNDVFAVIDVEGHWTSLEGANPFDGEIGEHSVVKEKLMRFRVKKEYKELANYLIKKAHPYEVPVINIL